MGAPTLILGLGGLGGRVVRHISDRIGREGVQDVELAIIDTDVNDLREINENYPGVTTIQISPYGTVGKALDLNSFARDNWFPLNDGLVGKPFTEGAGQVRAISRLAFDYTLSENGMHELEQTISKLHGLSGDTLRQVMRIIIVSSIAGGTGSGLVLPVAMYLRNYLESKYQDKETIIRGFFLEPDVLFGRINDEDERNSLRANAYASVREMDAFFRRYYAGDSVEYKHVVFNAPEPGSGEHVDYPNILPYHFAFLMDANNMAGKQLTDISGNPDLDAYLWHAADCIYAQALSAVSARSNSSEDNVIRRLAESNGRSRYCGAGYSCLEYPKEDVQRYIAFSWAQKNIANEWMELDHEFEKARRDDPDIDMASWYVTNYDSKRGAGIPFYDSIMRASERKDKEGVTVNVIENYIEALTSHADAWSKENLLKQSAILRRCVESESGASLFTLLPTSDDQVLDRFEGNGAEDDAYNAYNDFWKNLNRYSRVAQEEIPNLARTHARGAFTVSELDEDPLVSRSQDWQIEVVFRKMKDARIGSFHPTAVRYYLYKLSVELERIANESRDDADTAKNFMIRDAKSDYDPTTEEREDVPAALMNIFGEDEQGLLDKLRPGGKSEISAEQAEKLGTMGDLLNRYYKHIEAFREKSVLYAFAQAALDYVKGLIDAYETFYRFLDSQGIDRIRSEIESIELNPEYNETRGRAHRYVCANRQSLEKMRDICQSHMKSGDLPIELCGDIYNDLIKYAGKRKNLKGQYAETNEMSQKLFQQMFDDVIVDYWSEAVMDPHAGYPDVIDKNIIQAIGDEAIYRTDQFFSKPEDRDQLMLDNVVEKLKEAHELAMPFIEPPDGEMPRSIEVCAFSEEAFSNNTPNAGKVRQLLENSYQGMCQKAGEFSKYEILFYRSVYGFCAGNLPKYYPGDNGLNKKAEGEYHRAYYALVNQLSPNLKENRLITPHIDKNWHLISFMPDINGDYECMLRKQIVRAFLHGLIFTKFNKQPVADKDNDDIFYLPGSKGRMKINLWVTNGSPCDRFYEIYDALEFSPPAVTMLIESSQKRLMDEKDNAISSAEECALVEYIRSKAYDYEDFDGWAEGKVAEIVSGVQKLNYNDLYIQAKTIEKTKLDSSRIVNLFGYGLAEETPRTSIFEIPLLYRLSLPTSELREDQLYAIVNNTYEAIKEHLSNFTSEEDLYYKCSLLFIEQYLRFEKNLLEYEREYPGINGNDVVMLVRDSLLDYLEDSPRRRDRIRKIQKRIVEAWDAYTKRR